MLRLWAAVYTMFITKDIASFHLWWKKNLVKHQKVSKYYDHDCRFDREDYWIETLRTSYCYDLNQRKGKAESNLPGGCSFPLIPRSKQRSKRCRNNVNFWNFKSMESTFNCIHNCKTDDIKNPFYHIHIHWTTLERNILEKSLLKFY